MTMSKEQFQKRAAEMNTHWTTAVESNVYAAATIREEVPELKQFDPKLAALRAELADKIEGANMTIRAIGAHLAKVLEP